MKYGIAGLSIIPLRKEPNHRSEQVSQLLFGEYYQVEDARENWLRVRCCYDNYTGWMDSASHKEISSKDFTAISELKPGVAMELAAYVSSSQSSVPIVAGSSLHHFDGLNFRLYKERFVYNGLAVTADNARNVQLLEKLTFRYLNAPYQWGGRSPFGIDCSGFSQIIFKYLYIPLPRDAYQQAEVGSVVNFIDEARLGDLAFFANEESKITHVGIVLNDKKIIHASGKVRVDAIDHLGIYNAESKKYSHFLKVIKRIL